MIKDILNAMKKSEPRRTVTKIFDYDNDICLVEAVLTPGKVDYSDPYFGYVKKTGEVVGFAPTANLEKFSKVIKSKPLYSYK